MNYGANSEETFRHEHKPSSAPPQGPLPGGYIGDLSRD
jgi:hypothetical protein